MLTELYVSLLLVFFSSFLIILVGKTSKSGKPASTNHLPRSYPVIGHLLDVKANMHCFHQWLCDVLQNSLSGTFVMYLPLGDRQIVTANPANVQHILKTHFHLYEKGKHSRDLLYDILGNGIFNVDGDSWKFQRQIASHEFNTKSLRKFVETVVNTEISQRLIPFLYATAENGTVVDFQDILQRLAFDNICQIAFGYDPACLLQSLPQAKFAEAFEDSLKFISERFSSRLWKIRKAFNIGSEKQLQKAMSQVRLYASHIVKEKKQELEENSSLESTDLLSRFLSLGHFDETFVIDIVISFILAGRDTTSTALTWFFWLLSKHPQVEDKVVEEIKEKSETPIFEEVKDMVYTHACLCESMRLYPPVSSDGKVAVCDDVLPDGTVVKKGMNVIYHIYGMGRSEMLWGADWAEFKPERWLERDEASKKWNFVGRDAYTYPVFQAGPRICLGKEMAFLQMKRVVSGVLSKFKVMPAMEDGVEPEFIAFFTAKMKDGFPVKIVERT